MGLRATKGDENANLGKAGRGASRGPGGPPYFGWFSTVAHTEKSLSLPNQTLSLIR
jgi:hypothetical protein